MPAQFKVIAVNEYRDQDTDEVERDEVVYKMVFGPLTEVFADSEFVYAKELGVTTFSARKTGGDFYSHPNSQAMQEFVLFVAINTI